MNELILFEGKEIRAIEKEGELWFPLQDLAEAWGIDRTTPINIIGRNQEVFEGAVDNLSQDRYVTSPPVQCINERGLYIMMGRISAGRLKNKTAREAVIRFQRWVPELIQKYRKGEIIQAAQDPADQLKSEISRARMLASETGGDLAAFQAVALRKCGFGDYADALVPALKHGESGWLNPTQIGLRCGHSAREVNHFLEWHKFQYQSSGFWRLTEKGEQFGEEYFFESPSKHREIRIRWKESILTASGLVREPSETLALARV